MKKSPVIVYYIVAGICLFVIGGLVGFFIDQQMNAPRVGVADNALKALTSKVIPSITAFGQVQGVLSRTVTLSYAGDTLDIKIADDAKVSSVNIGGNGGQKDITLGDVKVGDFVNITLQVSQDGSITGTKILVIPFTTNANIVQ